MSYLSIKIMAEEQINKYTGKPESEDPEVVASKVSL
jgi:hypothetical protein